MTYNCSLWPNLTSGAATLNFKALMNSNSILSFLVYMHELSIKPNLDLASRANFIERLHLKKFIPLNTIFAINVLGFSKFKRQSGTLITKSELIDLKFMFIVETTSDQKIQWRKDKRLQLWSFNSSSDTM